MKQFLTIVTLVIFTVVVSAQTAINFPLTSDNTPSIYATGNEGCLILESASGTVAYNASGAYTNGWDNGANSKAWYTTAFNTTNILDLTVSFYYRTSALAGPRDFSLQYSHDNSSWTTVTTLSYTTATQEASISLPVACSNQPTLYLRLLQTSNTSVNSGTVTNTPNVYLKSFVVQGQVPVVPSAASNITLIAVTPTSINVGCSKYT